MDYTYCIFQFPAPTGSETKSHECDSIEKVITWIQQQEVQQPDKPEKYEYFVRLQNSVAITPKKYFLGDHLLSIQGRIVSHFGERVISALRA